MSRSQCTYTENPRPGHNSSLPGWIWIFHIIVIYDQMMCHDLDPRSFPQVQGHSAHIPTIYVREITQLPSLILILVRTIVVDNPRLCHDLDPKSYPQGQSHSAHIPKIYVWAIVHHCKI